MAIYSHSKLSTFEQCKFLYKLKYIERVKVDVPATIEMFLGSCVHKALEKLYHNAKYGRLLSVDELVKVFQDEWGKEWSDNILMVKDLPKEHFLALGEKFLRDFYAEYAPFDDFATVGLETEERLRLSDGSFYHVRIDRLASSHGTYYVCDFKTGAKLLSQEEANRDRQLAMYSIWVLNQFRDAKRVVLLWHFLAFNKEVSSERTREDLALLEAETVKLIKEIESETAFPANVRESCAYCLYQKLCPGFKESTVLNERKGDIN